MKRVIISDIHLSSANAVAPLSGQPYAWCDLSSTARFTSFLASDLVQTAGKLIIAGDFLDGWICPIDVVPPTLAEVIAAPNNQSALDAIRSFADTPGREVICIPGNHDMAMDQATVQRIHPRIVFGSQYDEGLLSVRHGHESSLFNAPDPRGRQSIGYWLSRFAATGVNRGLPPPTLDIWTILGSGKERAALLAIHPFAECVFDVTLAATGVTTNDYVVMRDGVPISVSLLRSAYANLLEDWRNHRSTDPYTAVLCEWDPYYDLPVGSQRLHVVGHSHQQLLSRHPSYGVYMNTGSWCGPNASSFVTVTDDIRAGHQGIVAQAFQWDGSAAQPLTDDVFMGKV